MRAGTDEQAGVTKETNAAYHVDHDCLGSSMLKLFRANRALFHAAFVVHTRDVAKPTPAMQLGSVAHTATLEPDRFDADYLVSASKTRRGKTWEFDVAEAEETGRTAILEGQRSTAMAIAAAVHDNPIAHRLLSAAGPVEQSLRWTDQETGLRCKARPDKLVDDDVYDMWIIADLKTAADPTPDEWCRQAWNFEYHCQAAHYLAGCTAALDPVVPIQFVFIVVGTEWPHAVYVYQVDADLMQRGRRRNAKALSEIVECHRTEQWRDPMQTELQTLSAPGWA